MCLLSIRINSWICSTAIRKTSREQRKRSDRDGFCTVPAHVDWGKVWIEPYPDQKFQSGPVVQVRGFRPDRVRYRNKQRLYKC